MRAWTWLFTTACLAVFTLEATVASGAPAAKRAAKGARPRHLSGEATVRPDQHTVDFDGVDVNGTPKAPMSSLVTEGHADMSYDFVKIRWRWHPEMVQSAGGLDASLAAR